MILYLLAWLVSKYIVGLIWNPTCVIWSSNPAWLHFTLDIGHEIILRALQFFTCKMKLILQFHFHIFYFDNEILRLKS